MDIHIDNELIARYVEGGVSSEEEAKIKVYLFENPEAQELVNIHKQIVESQKNEGYVAVPDEVTERTRQMILQQHGENYLDILIQLSKDALESVKSTAEVIFKSPFEVLPVLRGSMSDAQSAIVKKSFDDLNVSVYFDRIDQGSVTVTLQLEYKDQSLDVGDFRIILIQGDDELESYMTDNGKAVFEGVLDGKYTFEIIKSSQMWGKVSLQIQKN